MFEKSASTRHKNEIRVIVTLAGQDPFEAYVFLKLDERLIDLLNDQRQFIPIKRADGATLIAAKRNIVSIIENLDQPRDAPHEPPDAEAAQDAQASADETRKDESAAADKDPKAARAGSRRGGDPYEILRIPRTATIEEIKRAYHARIKAVHPDTLARLDLDEDIERAANLTAQRVNRAYRALLRERKADIDRADGAA